MTDRIQVAIAHAQSAQRELERGNHALCALDLAKAVRGLLEVMAGLAEPLRRIDR